MHRDLNRAPAGYKASKRLKEHSPGPFHGFPVGAHFQRQSDTFATCSVTAVHQFFPQRFRGLNHCPFPDICHKPQTNLLFFCLIVFGERPINYVLLWSLIHSHVPSPCWPLCPVNSPKDQSLTQSLMSSFSVPNFLPYSDSQGWAWRKLPISDHAPYWPHCSLHTTATQRHRFHLLPHTFVNYSYAICPFARLLKTHLHFTASCLRTASIFAERLSQIFFISQPSFLNRSPHLRLQVLDVSLHPLISSSKISWSL